MASVSQLGYIGIGVSDVKAWHDLATHVLGMQVIPGDQKSTSYLRMDDYHHRVELRPSGSDDLEFAGWEVPDQATLQRVAQQLEDGGVKVTAGTRDEADGRRVIDLIHCVDPSGVRTEVFCGRPIDPRPFHAGRPISGFKTGEMGLGHMVLLPLAWTNRFGFTGTCSGSAYRILPRSAFPAGSFALLSCIAIHAITLWPSWRPRVRQSESTISCWNAILSSTWASDATFVGSEGFRLGSTSAAT